MDRLWRSNFSVSSRIGYPPDIVNEEDHTVEENEFLDFQKWNIPKVDTKSIYKTSWAENTFYSRYKVRTVEQTFSISNTHEKCCLFSKGNINDFLAKKFSYLHIGLVQVVVKPLTRKGINALSVSIPNFEVNLNFPFCPKGSVVIPSCSTRRGTKHL